MMPKIPPGTPTRDLSTWAGRIAAAYDALRGRAPAADANPAPASPGAPGNSPVLGQRPFGPLSPLTPRGAPDSPEQTQGPRQFQYPVGANIVAQPRREYLELTPFEQLRNLSEMYDVASLCIAARVEEMQGIGFSIVAKNKRDQRALQDACDEVSAFFERPDGLTDFAAWLGSLIRAHMVYDALCVYPHKDRGGRLYALEPVDGSTVKPLLDDRGRTLAYQQVLYGYPMSDYRHPAADRPDEQFPVFGPEELIYRPRFTSTYSPYGSPPTEWIILRVNQAVRKQLFDLAYFTSGNMPEMFVTVPEGTLTPEQIEEFELWFNSVLEGNDAARRKVKFLPWAATPHELREFSYETTLDFWLLKITCAAYAVTPSRIGFVEDVNRATAQEQEAVAELRGLKPLARWLKGIFDYTIHRYFAPPPPREAAISLPGQPTRPVVSPYGRIECQWIYGDKADRYMEAQTHTLDIANGVMSADESRQMRYADQLEGPAPARPQPGAEGGSAPSTQGLAERLTHQAIGKAERSEMVTALREAVALVRAATEKD